MGIVKKSFFSFLFSDRRALPYWFGIFSIVCFFAWLSFFVRNVSLLYVFMQKGAFFLVYIGFYSSSYFNYRRYFVLQERLIKENASFKTGSCIAEIHANDFSVKPMKKSFDVNVKIQPYTVSCFFIQLNSGVFLFYYVLDIGVFKRYAKPMYISNTDNPSTIKEKIKSRVVSYKELQKDGERLIISFRNRSEEVNKIILQGLPMGSFAVYQPLKSSD